MKILPYEEKYQKQIEKLILDIQVNEFDIPITIEKQPDLLEIPNFYQKDQGNFWIALNEDKVVGTIALKNIGQNQGALRKMFVHKDFRGKKAAELLLQALIRWSKEKGFEQIFLGTTSKFLAAHRFYEKNGFQEIPKETLPPSFPIMAVDSKFYVLTLI